VEHTEGFSTRFGRTRTLMGAWRVLLAAVATLALLGLLASSALAIDNDDAAENGAYQILAPGEAGGVPPTVFSTDESKLYSALTPKEGNVSAGAIKKDYLSEHFEKPVATMPCMEESTARPCLEEPKPGVEIIRDTSDIPHIFGETRSDVMYGSGWVANKDRSLLLQFGLGPAFVAALSPPGLNAFELLLTQRSFTPSKEAEEYIAGQVKYLREKGADGEQVIEDLEAWCEGVNAAGGLPHIGLAQAIAGFAFIGSIFGNGGGGEVTNSNFLAKIEAKFGETEGLKVFHDLRESNDPEAPTTIKTPFPYDKEPTGPPPAGSAVIEPNSLSPELVKSDQALKASRKKASNFLLVGGGNTKNGHPVAVMGPQLGYYYPEIVFQADMHGPGVDAQGIVAPISPYVFIGRGRDFAWSLTSATSENTQQFLLKLCNPEEGGEVTRESEFYEHNGECIAMTTMDAGKLGAKIVNGKEVEPAREVFIKESIYGPVTGTVMVKGKPYGVSVDRSTRGHEPEGELAFSDFDSDRVHSPEQFFEAANMLGTTFNMAYIDSKNIAYFSTGRLPKTAPETDPALPTLGTGPYDWKGWLSQNEHPHEIAPNTGYLINWNNKPAPEWGAASENYSYGPLHRVLMFNGFKTPVTEARDVSVMNKAATQDFPAIYDWPVIQKVLEKTPAPSTLASKADKIVLKWIKSGAKLYGKEGPTAAGAAVIEKAFTPMAEAVLGPVLGPELLGELKSIEGVDNGPNSGGSSFGSGWYGYVQKDLRHLLGETEAEPYSRGYCGSGNVETCSQSLWAAMSTALESLSAEQGKNPKSWRAPKVQIEFPPAGTLFRKEFNIPWTNRSTFQQVIEFSSHQEEHLEGPLE
jgi:hypothetical protein